MGRGGPWTHSSYLKTIDTRLLDKKVPGSDEERVLRGELRELRKLLDDRVILALWRTIELRRRGVVCSILAIFLLLVLMVLLASGICFLAGCEDCTNVCKDGTSRAYSPFAMAIAGALGATLSTLMATRVDGKQVSPLLSNVWTVRPVIGAITGVFLFFVTNPMGIAIPYPGMYAISIAFGFTERAFVSALNQTAGQTGGAIDKLFA